MTQELTRLLDAAAVDADSIALSVDHMIRSGRRRRRGRTLLTGITGAGTLSLIVAGFLLAPRATHPADRVGGTGPARGADISYTTAGALVAVFHDPYASAATLRAVFKQRGLTITVNLVLASPSLVGKPVISGRGPGGGTGELTEFGTQDDCATAPRCPAGVTVSADWTGNGSIGIGVPTPSGQAYEAGGNATAFGEALYCSNIFGKTVKEAQAIVAARHLRPEWHGIGNVLIDPAKSLNQVVSAVAIGSSSGDVKIWAAPLSDVRSPTAMNLPCYPTAVARAR